MNSLWMDCYAAANIVYFENSDHYESLIFYHDIGIDTTMIVDDDCRNLYLSDKNPASHFIITELIDLHSDFICSYMFAIKNKMVAVDGDKTRRNFDV